MCIQKRIQCNAFFNLKIKNISVKTNKMLKSHLVKDIDDTKVRFF